MSKLVPGVMRGIRGPGAGALERIRRVWPEIVGPETAARARVAALDGGRLRVEVQSAALKHDLATFRRDAVLGALRRRLPELRIREVVYRV